MLICCSSKGRPSLNENDEGLATDLKSGGADLGCGLSGMGRNHLGVTNMSLIRHHAWSRNNPLHEEIKQVFDKFLNDTDADASSVVTSQWVPRVDIKEEAERFVIF